MQTRGRYIVAGFLGLAIDQLIKLGVIEFFLGSQRVNLGWGFGLDFYLNKQFAWSWPLANTPASILALGLLCLGGFFYFRRWQGRPELSPILLIGSGAVSNLIDRLFRGGVVDYLSTPGGGMINLADVLIFAGALFLVSNTKK